MFVRSVVKAWLGKILAPAFNVCFRTSFIQDKQQGRAQYVSSVHNKPELVVSIEVITTRIYALIWTI
jgi:hypothetical protein